MSADKRRMLPLPKGGKTLYTTRQSKAMTVNEDSVTLTVPDNKQWLVYWIWMRNVSGQTITMSIEIQDDAGNFVSYLDSQSVATGGDLVVPNKEGTATIWAFGHGAFPFLLAEGMKIRLVWGALADKSGTSYYLPMIKEFTP